MCDLGTNLLNVEQFEGFTGKILIEKGQGSNIYLIAIITLRILCRLFEGNCKSDFANFR